MKPIHLHTTTGNFRGIKTSIFILSFLFTMNLWGQEDSLCCKPWIPPTYNVDEIHWDEPASFWQNGGHVPENTVDEDTTNYARAHIKATGSATIRVYDVDSIVYPGGQFVGYEIKSRAFRDADFSGVTISTYLNGALMESKTGNELTVEYIPFYVNDPICIGFTTTMSWNAIEAHFDADGPRVHYDVFYATLGEDCPPETGGLPPLAVTWLSFDVQKNGETAEITWATTQEHNSSIFEIQRSSDGGKFVTIGSVPASTDNLEVNNYSYVDMNPMRGHNYYRIRQVDVDGSFSHSAIKDISFGSGPGIKSWPNPVTDFLSIEMPEETESAGEIRLVNSTGITVMNKAYENESQRTTLDLSRLEPGFYTLIIESAGKRHMERIVVIK